MSPAHGSLPSTDAWSSPREQLSEGDSSRSGMRGCGERKDGGALWPCNCRVLGKIRLGLARPHSFDVAPHACDLYDDHAGLADGEARQLLCARSAAVVSWRVVNHGAPPLRDFPSQALRRLSSPRARGETLPPWHELKAARIVPPPHADCWGGAEGPRDGCPWPGGRASHLHAACSFAAGSRSSSGGVQMARQAIVGGSRVEEARGVMLP